MFRTVPLSITRSFTLYTQQWYVSYSMRAGSGRNCSSVLILLTSCQQTCMTCIIAVCTVKNSTWWAEELSETCTALFQKEIWDISASSHFYCKNNHQDSELQITRCLVCGCKGSYTWLCGGMRQYVWSPSLDTLLLWNRYCCIDF